MMKTVMGAASAMALLFSAQIANAHEVDKSDWVEKSYDLEGFDEIRLQGVYDVTVEVGPAYSIQISGPAKRMDSLNVRVEGDQLLLDHEGRKKKIKKNQGLQAVVTTPVLTSLELQGVGSIVATGVDTDNFDVELEGVGSIEVSGQCDRLTASLEGIGSLDASDLKCNDVKVDVEGMGSAEVYASESVDAEIDGMGSIEVDGNPKDVKKSKSFMSSIEIN
jgi:hypothetical protein